MDDQPEQPADEAADPQRADLGHGPEAGDGGQRAQVAVVERLRSRSSPATADRWCGRRGRPTAWPPRPLRAGRRGPSGRPPRRSRGGRGPSSRVRPAPGRRGRRWRRWRRPAGRPAGGAGAGGPDFGDRRDLQVGPSDWVIRRRRRPCPVTMAPRCTSMPMPVRSRSVMRDSRLPMEPPGPRRPRPGRRGWCGGRCAGSCARSARRESSLSCPAISTPVGPPPITTKVMRARRRASSSSASARSKAPKICPRRYRASSSDFMPEAARRNSS